MIISLLGGFLSGGFCPGGYVRGGGGFFLVPLLDYIFLTDKDQTIGILIV